MKRLRTWFRNLAGIAGVVAFLCASPAGSAAAAEPFVVGIGQSIHDKIGVATALDWLGVQSVRLDAPWKSIEIAPGRYEIPVWLEAAVDSSRARGIEPLLILAYGHPLYGDDKPLTPAAIAAFTRYAAFVAAHFEGRARYFDLWNEWEAKTGHTTPGIADTYVALARSAYPAIKAANSAAVVMSGGMGSSKIALPFLERFVAQDGLEFVDALSLHPYNFWQNGTSAPEDAIAELDRVHALTIRAAKPLPIYVTEMGYPDFTGRGGVSADVAAVYLARFVLLASTRDYVGGVWWYGLRDQGPNPSDKEHRFGVLDTAMTPKPAALALRDVTRLLAQTGRLREEIDGAERRVVGERRDGARVVLSWRAGGTDGQLLADVAALVER